MGEKGAGLSRLSTRGLEQAGAALELFIHARKRWRVIMETVIASFTSEYWIL